MTESFNRYGKSTAPPKAPSTISAPPTNSLTKIKIGIPVLLIIFGMMDLGKAVMAQKEDEIKKGWQTFVKRMAAAVIVFLVVFIVQIVFNLVAGDNKESTWTCVKCFIDYNESACDNG